MKKVELIAIDQRDSTYEMFLVKWLNDKKIEFISFQEFWDDYSGKKGVKQVPDLLVFTGGADVLPSYYGEKTGSKTSCDPKRDELCMNIFKLLHHIPKLGICRGAQFLTVAAGGKLIQHVEGHTSKHSTTVAMPGNNRTFNIQVTSTHHQMLFPYNLHKDRFNLIGWSTKHRSNIYLNGKNTQMELPSDFVEPEIVHYPEERALAIQGHPEFTDASGDFQEVTARLIKELLL